MGVSAPYVATVVLGATGLLFASAPNSLKGNYFVITIFVLILSLLAIKHSLGFLSKEDLSKFLLSGQSNSNSITILSYMVRKNCQDAMYYTYSLNKIFTEYKAKAEKLLREFPCDDAYDVKITDKVCDEVENMIKCDYLRIKILIRLAQKHSSVRRLMLERIRFIIQKVSEKLCISNKRLCDHLLQYNPLVDEYLFDEFVNNSWAIFQNNTHMYDPEEERIKDINSDLDEKCRDKKSQIRESIKIAIRLIDKCNSIYEKGVKRLVYQNEIIRYYHLHENILTMIASPSSTLAVMNYTRCLGYLSCNFRYLKNREKSVRKYSRKLRFLHRKQRAYQGMDLNVLTRQILETGDYSQSRLQQFLKNRLSSDIDERTLSDLKNLSFIVKKYIHVAKIGIREKLVDLFTGIESEFNRSTVFITQGYSDTVKSCLDVVLDNKCDVYVLRPDGLTKSVKSNILYDDLVGSHQVHRNRIHICDQFLLPKIFPLNAQVFVLTGVEFFDNHNIACCNQEEMSEMIESLIKRKISVKCIAVAANYKKSKVTMYKNNSFLKDHLERKGTLNEHIEYIVTEDSIIKTSTGKLLEKSGQRKGGLFAVYEGKLYCKKFSDCSTTIFHEKWLPEIKLPYSGKAFDSLVRGRVVWNFDKKYYELKFSSLIVKVSNSIHSQLTEFFCNEKEQIL